MTTKRTIDHAALAARFQERAEQSLYDDSPGPVVLGRRQDSYIAPAPPPATLQQLPTADNIQQVEVMPAATVQTVVRTSMVDHSKGFLLRTLPLAAAFALAAVVVAVGLLAVPLLSMRTLIVVFVTFCLTYGWAFWKDLETSPAGIALFHSKNLWRHVHEERRFRHRWYERQYSDLRKDNKR